MTYVTITARDEAVRLDYDRIDDLLGGADPRDGEEAVCRALERAAVHLAEADRAARGQDWPALHGALTRLSGSAETMGMRMLARVALIAREALETADGVAVAATMARLLRLGERSLFAVWDEHDLSL
ncbi:hypothetical protein [Roseivivax sp. CAU 1761]